MSEQRASEPDRRYDRALRWGLAVSVLVHALLFLVFADQPLPMSPFAAAGERRGDIRAAKGGGMEAVEFRAPREARPETRREPEPEAPTEVEPEPEETTPEDFTLPALAMADLSVPGPRSALDVPGRVEGTGLGDGGTELEGRFRVVPPRPRGLILPPGDRPDDVRGREVEVWVFVTRDGDVVPDSTRLNPGTGDRRFDRRLREHAAGWVFEAARNRQGEPVSEWFSYTIIM